MQHAFSLALAVLWLAVSVPSASARSFGLESPLLDPVENLIGDREPPKTSGIVDIDCTFENGQLKCHTGFCSIPKSGESPIYRPPQGEYGAAVGLPQHDGYGPYVGLVVGFEC